MSMKSEKRVYYFSRQLTEGHRDMRDLLGGKGANLAEMDSIGLPVPPGFAVTAETCADYLHLDQKLAPSLLREIDQNIPRIGSPDKRFG